MIDRKKYKSATKYESEGGHGIHGIEILFYTDRELSNEEKSIFREMADKAHEVILGGTIRNDPAEILKAERERHNIMGLFFTPIYVDEIPNGYCPRECCKHLPWFIITTPRGRFKVGWRKSVLNIDWTETDIKVSGDDLFPKEKTTKGDRYMHAWSYDKAREYVTKLMAWRPQEMAEENKPAPPVNNQPATE